MKLIIVLTLFRLYSFLLIDFNKNIQIVFIKNNNL